MIQPLLSCPSDLGLMGCGSGQRAKTHIKAKKNSIRYKALMERQLGTIPQNIWERCYFRMDGLERPFCRATF